MRKRIYAVFAALLLCVLMVGVVSAEVVYPDEVTESSFGDNTIYVLNPSNTNGYYSSIRLAMAAAEDGATLYCKPDSVISEDGQHHPGTGDKSLTIYGNGAKLTFGDISFDTGEGVVITADRSLTIYNLTGVRVWGERKAPYTFTVEMIDCENAGGVYLTTKDAQLGTSAYNNITIRGGSIDASRYGNSLAVGLYSNGGDVTVQNVVFSSLACAINLNIKESDVDSPFRIIVENCTFEECGYDRNQNDLGKTQLYCAPIRICQTKSPDAIGEVSITNCSFTYGEQDSDNGDILFGEGREGKNSYGFNAQISDTQARISFQKVGDRTETTQPGLFVLSKDKQLDITGNGDGFSINLPEGGYWIGDGTETNPFQISDLDYLKAMRDNVNYGGYISDKLAATAHYKLTAGIDLEGTDENQWTPIGSLDNPFKGTFDGDNNTVSTLYIDDDTTGNLGFFGVTNTPAVLKNLKIEDVQITGLNYLGALAGKAYNGNLIQNCHVFGTVQIHGNYDVGGLTGYSYVHLIDNCSVIGDESSFLSGSFKEGGKANLEGDNVGGLIGYRSEGPHTISNCYADISVSGTRKVGGLIGTLEYGNTVLASSAEGNVSVAYTDAYSEDAGGEKLAFGSLIGEAHPYDDYAKQSSPISIKDSWATGSIILGDSQYDVSSKIGLIGAARVGGYGDSYSSAIRGMVTNCTYYVPFEDLGMFTILSGGELVNGGTVQITGDIPESQEVADFQGLKRYLEYGIPVKLTANIDDATETIFPLAGSEVTLDLAGYTITQTVAGELFNITNKANLTIVDNGGSGKILTNIPASGAAITVCNGALDVQSGTITRDSASLEAVLHGYTIRITGSDDSQYNLDNPYSKVTIGKDAVVEGYHWGIQIYGTDKPMVSHGVVLDVYGTVQGIENIPDLTGFWGPGGITVNGQIQYPDSGSVPEITIHNGATVTGYHGDPAGTREDSGGLAIYGAGYANWTINGGTFTGDEALSIKSGNWVITSGEFNAIGDYVDPVVAFSDGGEGTGSAVSITTNSDYEGNVNISITGATIRSKYGYAVSEYLTQGTTPSIQSISLENVNLQTDNSSLPSLVYFETANQYPLSITVSSPMEVDTFQGLKRYLEYGIPVKLTDDIKAAGSDDGDAQAIRIVGHTVELDLNGHTFTNAYTGVEEYAAIYVGVDTAEKAAVLTVKDTSFEGTGHIIAPQYGIFVKNSSKVIVDSVNITAKVSALTGNAGLNQWDDPTTQKYKNAEFIVTGDSALKSTDSSAMFVPAAGSKVTINGTVYIEGKSGLDICSGIVEISEEVIINATGDAQDPENIRDSSSGQFSSGPLKSGAAISLYKWNENYPGDIALTINDSVTLTSRSSTAISNYVRVDDPGDVTVTINDDAVFEGSNAVLSTKNYSGKTDEPKGTFTLNGGAYKVTLGNVLVGITPAYPDGKGMSTNPDSEGYYHIVEMVGAFDIRGPATVAPDVPVIFQANRTSSSTDTYVWTIDQKPIAGYTGNTMEYTFAGTTAEQTKTIGVTVTTIDGETAEAQTLTVTVQAKKAVPTGDDQVPVKPTNPTTGTKAENVTEVVFGQSDKSASGIVVTVTDDTNIPVSGGATPKKDDYVQKIPNATEVVQVLNFSVEGTAQSSSDLEEMAIIKFSVWRSTQLGPNEKIVAYRFSETAGIEAMPLETTYVLNVSAPEFTYDCTAYTPGFSDIAVSIISTPPAEDVYRISGLNVFTHESGKNGIISGQTLTVPVNLELTSGSITNWDITTSVVNSTSMEPVTTLTTTYLNGTGVYGGFKPSTEIYGLYTSGTPITGNLAPLFTLNLADTNTLTVNNPYTVTISIAPTRIEQGQNTHTYAVKTLSFEFIPTAWQIDADNNTRHDDKFGNTQWYLENTSKATMIVRALDYTSTGNDLWPTITRNDSAVYTKKTVNLSNTEIWKATGTYDPASPDALTWTEAAAGTTATITDDGHIAIVRDAADPATYFKLVFTGRGVGDVKSQGPVETSTVTVTDVTFIAYEAVTPGGYVLDDYKIYADVNHDGSIALSDAILAFTYWQEQPLGDPDPVYLN